MPVIALPDVMGAIVARLRSFPEILAFVTTSKGYTESATPDERARPRVSPRLQSFWRLSDGKPASKGGHAILVQGPIGRPSLDDSESGVYATRTDLHIYGPTPHEAMRLWRIVEPALCPFLGAERSFVSGGVRFGGVVREGGPNALTESQTNFPKVVATYVFVSSGVAVS